MTRLKLQELISGVIGMDIELEHPGLMDHGDYTTNVAMHLSSSHDASRENLRDFVARFSLDDAMLANPRLIAEKLKEKLSEDNKLLKYISKIEVAGPGFINFWLKEEVLMDNLKEIVAQKTKYGNSNELKSRKIMVEYAHPNTHKELHVGHMRTLTLGESLARIFEATGAQVFRANYQGDVGPHVAKSIWGTRKFIAERNLNWEDLEKKSPAEKAHLLGEGYVKGSQEYDDNKEEIDSINKQIYEGGSKIKEDYERTRRWSLEYYDTFYSRFGTKFDKLYFESEVAQEGKEIVMDNIGKVFEKSEGAIVFKGEKYDLHTRVFVTSDGTPTYEAKEMALAPKQFSDFEFDKNIHVVANEQKGYFEVVFKALTLIDPKFENKEEHLSMGMINLVGKKISSRTGDIVRVDALLNDIKKIIRPLSVSDKAAEQVTIAAVKYSVLKVNPSMDVLFDIKKSVDVNGNSGPYLQYTYARTQSVLEKAKDGGVEGGSDLNSEELTTLRLLSRFPEIIVTVSKMYSVNLLCNYLYELAQSYNTFYNAHKIIGSDNEKLRVALTKATGQVIKNGLHLLGIESPEKM